MTDQEDGAYPRINGAMLQSQQYNGMLVSAVGKVTGHNTLLAVDGVSISLDTDAIAEALIVNPGMAVEIIGVANDATTIQAFVSRNLGADLDMDVYNKMIAIQSCPQYAHYFQAPMASN